jgi:AraC family transcriptional regulator, transcriptional activator of pobA
MFIDVESVSELHKLFGVDKPKHPLISIIDLSTRRHTRLESISYRLGIYMVFCKKHPEPLQYGRSYYDFSEGLLMFTAPGQVVTSNPNAIAEEGWGLFFHPDLINVGPLGRKIKEYGFFHYEANEALYISEEETSTLLGCLDNIRKEYSQNIDKHSNDLIRTNLDLLLNYCSRFYERQFYTREKISTDTVQQFEKLLKDYFTQDPLTLPNVGHFAAQLHLSPNYLSDLLQRFTGKTTQEHIHLQIVDVAKSLLLGTSQSVSEIAYTLGFEHLSHFTRLFKHKTGHAPSDYRRLRSS